MQAVTNLFGALAVLCGFIWLVGLGIRATERFIPWVQVFDTLPIITVVFVMIAFAGCFGGTRNGSDGQ